MPKTPKKRHEAEKEKSAEDRKDSWEEDQKKKEYYYDDAHGYKIFNPDNEDEDDPKIGS